MKSKDKKKNEIEWFDNPNVVTNLIILMIGLIVILSQSFAVNNGLGVAEILSGILNHNIGYLLVFVYFVALKIKVGKRYFDFLNIFLIVLYGLTTITSLLTLLQSFGLGSLLGFGIDLMIFIYMIHTFLRSTIMWKSMGLNKSPFNEINNSGYFYSILVLSVTLLAVNLISTTSLDGTILTLMDALYTILFIRYIFLYGEYLDSKKISINNEGSFDQVTDKVKEEVNSFIEDNKLDEKFEDISEKVNDFVEDVKEKIDKADLDEKFDAAKKKVVDVASDIKDKAIEIKDDVVEKIEEAKLDEKFETAKGKVSGFVDDLGEDVKSFVKDAKVEEKIENAKKKVNDFVAENKLDEKFEKAKDKVTEITNDVVEDVKTLVKETKVEEKVEKAKKEVSKFVNEVKDDVNSLVGNDSKKEEKVKKKFFSRKKKPGKEKNSKVDTKKGSK